MKHRETPKVIVKGKNHIIISGTGNFFNGRNKNLLKLVQRVNILEKRLKKKERTIKEKDRTIKALMKNK